MFAVEDTAIQVVWPALPAARVCLEVGDQVRVVDASPPAVLRRRNHPAVALPVPSGAAGGPGAVTFGELRPATEYDVTVSGPGLPRRLVERVTTLAAPPGRRLDGFATINDLHLGEQGFGVRHDIEEVWPLPPGQAPYTWRAVDAAVAEARRWGAAAVVVKGDMTAEGLPAEFHEIGRLLGALPLPVLATFGNHEHHNLETDGRAILAEYGIDIPREPWAVDRPGIRLVFALTARPGERSGAIEDRQRRQLVALVAAAPGPAFVVAHHQLQRWRWPTAYPPGVAGPEARALLDELAAVNPATLFASGHTHRHRRRRYRSVELVEVGSTKDYPGTWTGYAVHEGGIRQVVRRIESPGVIAWTEATAHALGGIWGRWSPGRREERCFTHRWPALP